MEAGHWQKQDSDHREQLLAVRVQRRLPLMSVASHSQLPVQGLVFLGMQLTFSWALPPLKSGGPSHSQSVAATQAPDRAWTNGPQG